MVSSVYIYVHKSENAKGLTSTGSTGNTRLLQYLCVHTIMIKKTYRVLLVILQCYLGIGVEALGKDSIDPVSVMGECAAH